jgi:hypothetical protein
MHNLFYILRISCASSWFTLHDYIEMRGQQNVKFEKKNKVENVFLKIWVKLYPLQQKLDSCSIIQSLMESSNSEPIRRTSLCFVPTTKQYLQHIRRGTTEGREYTTTYISWVSTELFHIKLASIL